MRATFGALREGARRALRAPFILLWLWLVGIAVAAPAAWVVARAIEDGLGRSLAQERLRDGFDAEWHARFAAGARGLEATFTPGRTGAGALLDNLDDWLDGSLFGGPPAVVAAGAVHVLLWIAMLGGVLDRFADPDARAGVGRFFRASGRLGLRLLRLALLSGLLYVAVYRGLWIALARLGRAPDDVPAEGVAFVYHAGIVGAAALALFALHACFAFAKVAIVVDGRRSMLLAAWRGLGFVVGHPLRVAGLYAAYGTVASALLAVWVRYGPGIGQSDWRAVAAAFAAGQLLLVAQLFARLWLLAAQVALYQSCAGGAAKTTEPAASPAHDSSSRTELG